MNIFRKYEKSDQQKIDVESYGNFIILDEVGLSKIEEDVLIEYAILIAQEISKKMIDE